MAHRVAHILADLLGGALGGLERDVAGETLGDDDVDRALAEIVAFDEAVIARFGKAVSRSTRPAALTSSRPLISSTPTLRRPTVGLSMSNTMRAIAAPMIARSIRCWASAPIVAPTSSTIDSPRSVGHIAAIAGRSICAIVRRQTLAIAISAPVLPAETAQSASPFFTASIACHIDDDAPAGAQRLARLVRHLDRDVAMTDARLARSAGARPAAA